MAEFEADIREAISHLNAGGVLLYPTDTIWGLGCNAFDGSAIDKIFSIKKRPPQKSMIVLLADARDVLQYVAAPHPDIIDIVGSFEQPTTVIYEHALGFPDNLVAEDGSIAIRVTNDAFCKSLIKRFGKPIVSTSANISGAPSPTIFAEVSSEIRQNADFVVHHRQNDNTATNASRIVTINKDGSLNIIRG